MRFLTSVHCKCGSVFVFTNDFQLCQQVSKDFEQVCTMHANCCTGLQRKLHDLRLVMADWRRFKLMSPQMKHHQRIYWRAPRQCLLSFGGGWLHTSAASLVTWELFLHSHKDLQRQVSPPDVILWFSSRSLYISNFLLPFAFCCFNFLKDSISMLF